ncbi:MAG TPA: SLC13 family permease [Acidobacteriota bacterium]|nr:SLC13 family permease [Acidobacteriota bacterium]
MLVLSLIILGGIVLFVTEAFPVDKVSILILASLVLFRLISPSEALSGFGNPATITVACMLALSFGIERTGALNFLANRIIDLSGGSEVKVLLSVILAVGILSAFINNTAAVAMFIPLCVAVAREQNLAASRLLMPMSFAAIFAGTCTLIGTSTNLLVYGVVQEKLNYSIGMFEVAPLGLIFFGLGSLYLLFIGRRFLPVRELRDDLTERYRLRSYVTELILLPKSPLIGKTLAETRLGKDFDIEVFEIWRGKEKFIATDSSHLRLQEGDILLVSGDPEKLIDIQRRAGVLLEALQVEDRDLEDEDIVLVEAFISPNSRLAESTLADVNFRGTYKANALAIRRHGKSIREKIGRTKLQSGDSLLVLTTHDQLATLRDMSDFLIIEEVRVTPLRKEKAYYATSIFAAIVLIAATGVLEVVEAALIGVALMTLTGCIRLRELYSKMSWTTLVMLGCLIPLGVAMDSTGLASLVATYVINTLRSLGPIAVLSGIYLLTSLLTEVLSNNATAVLMLPIALSAATQLDANATPFIFAVMFAASASFMTPVGYQTNTMIFGPGGYKFSDYIKVGAPLSVLFWLLATIFIPVFWPL